MAISTGNRIKLHNVWEPTTNQYVPGLVNGYREGDSASFIVEIEIPTADQELINLGDDGIAGTTDDGMLTLDFNIFLDLVADNGADGYAFVDLGDFDDTLTPPIPNTAGGNTIVDSNYSYSIAESETANTGNGSVTVLQPDDGTDNIDILSVTYNGADFSSSVNFQTWNVEYKISDTGTYYFLYGGVLAQPGDTVPTAAGGTTTAEFGASEAGNFQARIVSEGTGDKTVPFTGGRIEPIAADPELNIVKDANVASVDAPGDITYTYTVTNTVENSQATNVTVEDDNATPGDNGDDFNPTFVSGDTDNDGNLDFGETWTYQETVSVTQEQIDSGADIVNIATADSSETDPVTDDATVTVIQNPVLLIDKIVVDSDGDGLLWNDANGNDLPDEGETIDYSVKVTNDGNITLTNVDVDDPIAGIDETIASLAPAEMATFTGSYALTQADIDAGIRSNTATADSEQTDSVDDTEDVILPQDPNVDLVKEVDLSITVDNDLSQDTSAGDELIYTFEITNTGNVTLNDVTLSDPLPGLSDIDFGSFDGTLDPGESVTGTATYIVTPEDVAAGDIENTATVTAEAPGGDPDNPDDDVTDTDTEIVDLPQPALEINKTSELLTDADSSQDVSAGDTIRYTIDVSNIGEANLTGVTVFDSLANSFLTLSDSAGDGVDFLAAGDSETAIFDYVVQESDLGTTISNTATADSVQTGSEEDTENVDVPQSELLLSKDFVNYVDNDENGEITQGDVINYSLTATNDPLAFGGANLTNVTISDDLTGDSQNFGTLAPNGTATLNVSYTVTEQDALTGEVSNIGVADSDQTDEVTDSEDVPVKLAVDIDIKPGSFPSSFNLRGNGIVPVAIFSTDNFDATQIDQVCLEEFEPGPSTGEACTSDINFDDVNGDGLLDAVAQFSKPDLIGVLDTESTFAKLTGTTDEGLMFVGIGDVNVTQV